MTFEAFWELLRWAGLAGLLGLVGWIAKLESKVSANNRDLHQRREADKAELKADITACRAEHRASSSEVRLELAREYVTAAAAAERFGALDKRLEKIDGKLDRLLEGRLRHDDK